MRIIMGITYCLQYLHHELSPPIVHLVPKSTSIFITDDYAAKVIPYIALTNIFHFLKVIFRSPILVFGKISS